MTLCGNPESTKTSPILYPHHLATQVSVSLRIVTTFSLFEFFVKNSTFSNFILVIVRMVKVFRCNICHKIPLSCCARVILCIVLSMSLSGLLMYIG